MNLSDNKTFLKVRNFLLECEKIVSKFNFFSRKDSVFKEGVSSHESIDMVDRIAVKEGIVGFTLKVNTVLSAELLAWMDQGLIDVFCREVQIFITCGDL